MAFRTIIKYPSRALLKKSKPVGEITEDTAQLVTDLRDTLNVAGGVGLSAPQIGFHDRVIYVACPQFKAEMINPVIKSQDVLTKMDEGCLSFPGVLERIDRYARVDVEYTTLDGETKTASLDGLPAQVVQHEIEHLDGKLMIDNLSRLKRGRAVKRVTKVTKEVNGILAESEATTKVTKVKKDSHLSKKEIKIRRQRRKQNR